MKASGIFFTSHDSVRRKAQKWYGIDLGRYNIPSGLSLFDISNFDRDKRMPEYLDLEAAHRRLGSDGLVRINNATVCGLNPIDSLGQQCAKAFTLRSHPGPFGIVNSEEGYQNLSRFLFGVGQPREAGGELNRLSPAASAMPVQRGEA